MKKSFLSLGLALLMLTACANDPQEPGELRIHEVHVSNGDALQFVELQNVGQSSLELAGAKLSGDVQFSFLDSLPDLAPHQLLVLTNDTALFHMRFPGVACLGPWLGALDNHQMELRVEDAQGKKMAEAEIRNEYPWPTPFAHFSWIDLGQGDAQDGSSWGIDTQWEGTPGTVGTAALDLGVEISELFLDTALGFVELHNLNAQSVDVSGWALLEGDDDANLTALPANSVIAANGYLSIPLAVWKDSFFPAANGDRIYLMEMQNELFTGRSVSFAYPYIAPQLSVGGNAQEVQLFATPTPGAANQNPQVSGLRISEIHYHPADSGLEFVELWQQRQDTVMLDSRWSMEGITPNFPAQFSWLPNQRIVLIPEGTLDTAVYRVRYQVPAASPIFTYSGKLSNRGEVLTLLKPESALSTGWGYSWADRLYYTDQAPWPLEADGQGMSLQLDSLGEWMAATPTPGY